MYSIFLVVRVLISPPNVFKTKKSIYGAYSSLKNKFCKVISVMQRVFHCSLHASIISGLILLECIKGFKR